jgi:hypothetical protein
MSDDRFYIRPPENFYELSEEEQLAWTRRVGDELRATPRGEPAEPGRSAEPDRAEDR